MEATQSVPTLPGEQQRLGGDSCCSGPSFASASASASIVIAPPPVSLWARRNQTTDDQFADPASRIHPDYHHHYDYDYDYNNNHHYDNHDLHHHHQPRIHLRADSSVLGLERPRIMSRAHVAAPPTPAVPLAPQPPPSPSSVYSSPPATPKFLAAAPLSPRCDHYGGPLPVRLSARMPLEILPRAHWLSRVRSCLRLLIIVLSGAVVFMLMHTLGIYRGNRYLELRKGEIPMVWPAHTNLAPTIILTAVAAANFLASVAILSLSFKRSFRRPIRSRDLYRILAGSFGVVLWAAALVVFHLLDHASKASLRRYSCTNAAQLTNGRFQYRAVCEEQNVAFYTALGASAAELLTLLTLAASAIKSLRDEPPLPTIQIHEKKDESHLSRGWRPARPKSWIQ